MRKFGVESKVRIPDVVCRKNAPGFRARFPARDYGSLDMTRDSAALRPRWYKTTTAPIDHIVEREKAAVKEQAKVLAKTEHAQQEQERRIQLKMRHMKMQLSS